MRKYHTFLVLWSWLYSFCQKEYPPINIIIIALASLFYRTDRKKFISEQSDILFVWIETMLLWHYLSWILWGRKRDKYHCVFFFFLNLNDEEDQSYFNPWKFTIIFNNWFFLSNGNWSAIKVKYFFKFVMLPEIKKAISWSFKLWTDIPNKGEQEECKVLTS